ncbi:diguanylate cyclase [Blastopirellula sp. JC732]|uniref:diguanylate cyclase n=1 Tax=Blastopirellula sediminis TaxID=2894196 RepID=A0A9X1MQ35_9BACT|nr:diguanylate cyclase [Blastopirellula sediminis]MCC9606025.1 diguanylate cyclase [Blastopirellula sediminis]MCC9630676.1 diguanylate cyclase [Blastopirellula sediminis]
MESVTTIQFSTFLIGMTCGVFPLLAGLWIGIKLMRDSQPAAEAAPGEAEKAAQILQRMSQFMRGLAGDVHEQRDVMASIEERIDHARRNSSGSKSLEQAIDLLKVMNDANDGLQERLKRAETLINEQTEQLAATLSEARTDSLTKLFNRRAFDEELHKRWALWNRKRRPFCVLLVDIDYFKKINDRYGHQIGDAVLQAVAKTLVQTTRDADYVTRYGGEEFAILLPETELEKGNEAAQRILAAVREDVFREEAIEIPLTVSIGVAQVDDLAGPEELVAKADEALYAAKKGGRDRGYYFDGQRVLSILPGADGKVEPAREFHEVCADLRTRLMEATH